ncbi:MAG: T9SS type A sorting domain-containing protein [Chitinophagaceae bacterium]|nr:T9SS type A sorting domain-containing protein [Chitinophagaceae bacterium]
MIRSFILFFAFVASSLLLFKQTKIATHKGKFSLSEATDYDELRELQEQLMLADPSTGKVPNNIRKQELDFYNQYLAPFQKKTRSEDWHAVGPWNVGGRTRAIAFDKTNENFIIAGSVSGGIWRTTNGGLAWTQVSDVAGYLGVTSLCQDKRIGKENIWYACTGEGSGNSASGGGAYFFGDGLFKSIDSGKSWQPMPTTSGGNPNSFTTPFQVSWRIATHPSVDSDYLFVANYGCIYRSNNGGNTWTVCRGGFGGTDAYYTDLAIDSTGIIYATVSSDGTGKGFFRSADKGLTWADITPINFNVHDRTVLGINPNNPQEVFFFSYIPDSTNIYSTTTSNYKGTNEWITLMKYTYISGDGSGAGGNWDNLSPNLPNNANISSGPFDKLNCQGGYDMFVKVQPGTGNVFIGGTNIFRSTDAFATANNFTQIGGYKLGTTLPHFEIWDNHHPDNHDLLFYPSNPNKLLSASDGGVRMTMDGNSPSTMVWITLNNGYLTSQVYTVTLDPTVGSKWLLAGFQDNGNFITTDYTNAQNIWKIPFNGDGAYNYIAPNRDFYVMSIQEGKVVKFNLDNTGSVISYGRIDPIGPTKDDYLFINPFVVDPNDNNILYLPAGKSLWRQNQLSTLPFTGNWDSIATGWTKLSDTITASNSGSTGQYPAQITAIAVSKSPANTVYIGTSNKDVYRIDNANTGNPTMVKISKTFMTGYCSGIAIDPEDNKKVLVCYSNYTTSSLFYSTTAGDTFRHCKGNLRSASSNWSGYSPSLRCVAIAKTTEGKRKYYVGTSVGLFSTDTLKESTLVSKDSTSWKQEGVNSIGTNVVVSIDQRPADGIVAIGTHGGGAFYSKQFFPLAIQPAISSKNKFNLSIFPNPAQDICTLQVTLQFARTMHLYIVDIFGRKCMTIGSAKLNVGQHNFSINTSALNAGRYVVVAEDELGQKITNQLIVQ